MRKYYIIMIVVAILCLGMSIFLSRPKEVTDEYTYESELIDIEIDGAVVFEGKYRVFMGIKLYEVINLAGGLKEDANTNGLDLNEVISKPKKYSVPYINKYIIDKVNINTAKFEELLEIPNITEQRAASIIIHRQTYGYFKSIEEIVNVKYIGNATFDKIKNYITV